MRSVRILIALPTLVATLAAGVPAALAAPTPDVPVPGSAASERYTPYSRVTPQPDGTQQAQVYQIPAFTRFGDGRWRAVDTRVHPSADSTDRDAFTVPGGYRPLGFGRSPENLVSVQLQKGPVRLSAQGLRRAGRPEQTPDGVVYRGVAQDTDLTVRPSGAGFRTVLRLHSPDAPTSFRFHLSDPGRQLGQPRRTDDGGYEFDTEIEPGVRFGLRPAYAYEVDLDRPDQIPGRDPGSAELTVTAAGDGFDIIETVDPQWLKGKTFPIELDPLAYFGREYGTTSRDCHIVDRDAQDRNYCHYDVFEVGYGSGIDTGWSLRRAMTQFDVSGVPSNAHVNSAYVDVKLKFNYHNTDMTVAAYETGEPWTNSATWRRRDGIASWSISPGGKVGPLLSSTTVRAQETYHSWPITSLAQRWVNGTAQQHGITLIGPEPSLPNGESHVMRFYSHEDAYSGSWPYLAINYTPPPDAPTDVNATEGNTASEVRWAPPSNESAAQVTTYRVSAYPANNPGVAERTVECLRPCSKTTVSGLTNGRAYVFGVAAVNAYTTGPEGRTPTGVTYTPYGNPYPPTGVDVRVGSSQTATVSWQASQSNGRPVTAYYAYAYLAGTTTRVGSLACDSLCASSSRQVTFTGLTNGQPYDFTVQAYAPAPDTTRVYSAETTRITKTPHGSPNAPTIDQTGRGDQSAWVSWFAPTDTNGATITGYTVTLIDTGTGNAVDRQPLGAAARRADFSMLTNGNQYSFKVTVRYDVNGVDTEGESVTGGPVTPARRPSAPATVSATVSGGAMTVVWTPPTDDGGEPVTLYDVAAYRSSDNVQVDATKQFPDSSKPATFPGLTPGQDYYAKVWARNVIGLGDPATSSSVPVLHPLTIVKEIVGSTKPVYQAGDAVTYKLTISNVNATSVDNVLVRDTGSAGVRFLNQTLTGVVCPDGSNGCAPTDADGGGQSMEFTVASVPPGGAAEVTYSAQLDPGQRGCRQLTNTATLPDEAKGQAQQDAVSVLGCHGGLGLEGWWSFTGTQTGPQAQAQVNVGNGNAVVSALDSTPVPARGRLSYALRRTYNSSSPSALPLPGSLGFGWSFNFGETGDAAADAITASAIVVPSLGSALDSITTPLSVALVDRDGTRHLFAARTLNARIPITSSSAVRAELRPASLSAPAGKTLCVDLAYDPPPGVHLGLWRYIATTSSDCQISSTTDPVVVGFAAVRPDRLRTEYDHLGRLRAVIDPAGVQLRYLYGQDPLNTPDFGRLTAVFEPLSCRDGGTVPTTRDQIPTSCRAFRFDYRAAADSTDPRVVVTDPARRATTYVLDKALPSELTDPVAHLIEVRHPDGTSTRYGYGGCGGSADQLCTITTPEPAPAGSSTKLSYAVSPHDPAGSPARAVSLTDRRGTTTGFTYRSSTQTAAETANPGGGTAAQNATPGRQQLYDRIDSAGRVGLQETYDLGTGERLHKTTFEWDTAGCRASRTAAEDAKPKPDNNLCAVTRHAASVDPGTGKDVNDGTDNERTEFRYTPQGQLLHERRVLPTGALVTTHGYTTQYVAASGDPVLAHDTVSGGGNHAISRNAPSAGTLFAVTDRIQMLTPRGNQAAGGAYVNYLTTYTVDNNHQAAVNATGADRAASAADSPCTAIVSDGTAYGTPAAVANTGALCQTSAPSTGNGKPSVSRASYDGFGQKTTSTTPKAIAEATDTDPAGTTVYSYFDDGDGNTAPLDVSGTVRIGGWLRHVTDPAGNFVAYDYDAAGNTVRTWDRDATAGKNRDDYPGPLTASRAAATGVPGGFSEARYGNGGTAFSAPWRYLISSTDQLGHRTELTVDDHGNTTRVRPPRGTAANTGDFDTTYTYAAGDLLTATSTPLQTAAATAGTRYSYDPFGNRVSEVGPDTAGEPAGRHAVVHRYDAADRPVKTLTSRGPAPADGTGAQCRPATAADAPIVAGTTPHTLCVTAVGYDHVDNPTSTVDGNGAATATDYDAVHRPTDVHVDRKAGGITQTRTSTVYDADGNPIRHCAPRHYADGAGKTTPICGADAIHAQHASYNDAGLPNTVTVYRDTGQPLTTTLAYDPDGNTTAVTDPRGTASDGTPVTVHAGYDLLGRRTSTTVPRAGTTKHSTQQLYTPSGNLLASIEPGTVSDNPNGPPVRVTGHSYDAAHRPVDTVRALQIPAVTAADVQTAVATAVADADRQVNLRTRVGYDADGRMTVRYGPRAFTGPGQVGTAALLAAPDERFATRTGYDRDGRPVTQDVPRSASGIDDLTRQDGQSDEQKTQCPAGADGYPADVHVCRTKLDYDALGNLTAVWLPTGTATADTDRRILFGYTDDNLQHTVDAPDPRTDGQRVKANTRTFDGAGRAVQQTNALGRTTTTTFTADGLVSEVRRPTGANDLSHVTQARYDADGNPIAIETPRTVFDTTTGQKTGTETPVQLAAYYADGLLRTATTGRTTTTPPSQYPAVDNTISYLYDAAGNPTAVTSPNANAKHNSNPTGEPTRYTYTADRLLARTTQPVQVGTTGVTQARVTSYSYDPAGRKTAVAVALTGSGATDGGTQSFGYHPTDALASQSGRGGDGRIEHAYDAAGAPVRVTGGSSTTTGSYYLDGLPREVISDGRRHAYAYDGNGQLTARGAAPAKDPLKVTRYSYSDAGLPQTMTVDGRTDTWTHTELGQVFTHTRSNGQTQRWEYAPDDLLTETSVTGADGLLARWTYRYDELNRIVEQAYQGKAAAPSTDLGTGSGPAGTETGTPTPVPYRTGYDSAGRLSSFTDARGTRTLRFDHNNNRTVYGEGAQPEPSAWTYRADDSIATATVPGDITGGELVSRSYTYHPFGGVRSDSCLSYSYDGFDRLSKVTGSACRTHPTVGYSYDGLDRQTGRTATGQPDTNIWHDGWTSAVEHATTGGVAPAATSYALDPSGRAVAAARTGSSPELLFTDGTGSTGLITLAGQSVRCVARYDAYGSPNGNTAAEPAGSCASGSAHNQNYYRGERKDLDTGNYQLGSRTYDPSKAAFLTADSYRTAGSAADLSVGVDPLTRNTYSYVNGDPINLTDPNGHEPRPHHDRNYRDYTPTRNESREYERGIQQAHAGAVARRADSGGRGNTGGPWWKKTARSAYNTVAGAGAGLVHVGSDLAQFGLTYSPLGAGLDQFGLLDPITSGAERAERAFVRLQRERLGVDTDSRSYKIGDKGLQLTTAVVPVGTAARALSNSGKILPALTRLPSKFSRTRAPTSPGRAAEAAPTGNAYSVAFETQLDNAVVGRSRSVHFNRSNAALDDALRSDSAFASQFDQLIPGASSAVSRTGGRVTPGEYTWHHAPSSAAGGRVGVMQLVPTSQHAPGSIWQRLLHPGGSGGYSEWAIPRGAPR